MHPYCEVARSFRQRLADALARAVAFSGVRRQRNDCSDAFQRGAIAAIVGIPSKSLKEAAKKSEATRGDADGVALAAIQALYKQLQQKEAEIREPLVFRARPASRRAAAQARR